MKDTPKKPASKKATTSKAKQSKATKATENKPKLPKLKKAKKSEKVGYFKGSWQELQLVRWPDRRATWSLTLAVIIFSLFFAGLILGLDYIFENLFRKVIL